jgi:hypothetical protein
MEGNRVDSRCRIFSGGSRFYLLLFAVLCHEALVADVGEEEALVDGDVGGVLVCWDHASSLKVLQE